MDLINIYFFSSGFGGKNLNVIFYLPISFQMYE